MRTDDRTTAARTHLERAYQEFRAACCHKVSEAALRRGVLPADRPFTVEDFLRHNAIGDHRRRQADLFLATLARWGTLLPVGDTHFVRADTPPPFTPDPELMRAAIGRPALEDYPDHDNFALLVDELIDDNGATGAGFSQANLPLWEEALQAPYYRYSRLRAVAAATAHGNRLLDLACGLGHGLGEMAEALGSDPQAHLVGVEVSADFVAVAAARTAGDARISVLCADLDEPLHSLPAGGFDAAMMVGGYHFLHRPAMLWDTARRLIRPGGALVLAHVLSRTGSPDQDLMELRFALRRPPGAPADRADILDLAGRNGFVLRSEFTLGCYRMLERVRIPFQGSGPPAGDTTYALPGLTITTVPVGPLRTNAYLLRCHATGEQLLVDAAAEPDRLLTMAGGQLTAVATTHGDWDHTEALTAVITATGARSFAHPADLAQLGAPAHPVVHGDTIAVGRHRVEVIHIGGHSPGSVVFALHPEGRPAHLFTGDALFPGGVGTTWGDSHAFQHLLDNVAARIFDAYEDDTVVLPGHGPATTVGAERPHLAHWRARGW